MRAALPIVLLTLMLAVPAHAQDELEQIQRALHLAENALGEAFARALPLPSSSSGVSYSFDPATGNFQRDPATFGQVYLERADPLGARRFNVAFAYQYATLEDLEGHDASQLADPFPIPVTDFKAAFQLPQLDLGAEVHQFLFAATYGITDDLEVTAALPMIYSALSAQTNVLFAAETAEGELIELDIPVDDSQHPVGVGDTLLRAKYRVLELEDLHAAASLLLRIPTGTRADLQGIGYLELTPTALISTRVYEPAPWARLQGHLNAGVGFNTDEVDSSEARWGIGLDWGLNDDVTAAIAVLGQNQFARIGPAGSFDFPRCTTTDLVQCATEPSVREGHGSLFGLTGERPDYYTLSVGGRGALWRDTLFAVINMAIPLNEGFVRTAPIPLLGVEGTF